MKNMVKILLAAAAVLAFAASASARGGLEAGYLNSRYSFKSVAEGAAAPDAYSQNGFYAGLTQEVRLFAGLHVQTGIYYSYLTSKERREYGELITNGGRTDHYLSVPIMLKYKIGLPFMKISIFAGPTLSAGLVSKEKYTVAGRYAGATVNGDISYNFYTGNVKYDGVNVPADASDPYAGMLSNWLYNRFDVQIGAGVGLEFFKFLEVKAGYDWGLIDRYKGDGIEVNRDQFYVSLGFRF